MFRIENVRFGDDFDQQLNEATVPQKLKVARSIAKTAKEIVNTDTAAYETYSVIGKVNRHGVVVDTNDVGGHIIEYGSDDQAPQAPIRTAAMRHGRFVPKPK